MIKSKPRSAPLPSGPFMLNGKVYIRRDSDPDGEAFCVDDGAVKPVPDVAGDVRVVMRRTA